MQFTERVIDNRFLNPSSRISFSFLDRQECPFPFLSLLKTLLVAAL